ncbi:MAG: ATP-binding protein, partial [Geminicoccaceae bacterium]
SMPGASTADEHEQPAAWSGGNGHAAQPGAEAERGFGHKQPPPPRPAGSTAADALLGHVISVAGSVVWAALDADGATHAEIGAMVRLQGSQMRSFGIITTLKSEGRRTAERQPGLVEVRLLGEMAAGTDQFQRGVSSHPALDSPIHMASRDELRAIFARPDRPTVRLGTLHQASDLPAYAITDNLLGKHFAVLGTTGAGKSCSVTVILRAILEANPHGHIIMLDPHNEYAPAFGKRAELLNPGNLKLPYWLLNFEEIAEVLVSKDSPERAYAESAILRSAILHARRGACGSGVNTDHMTVDTPCPYRLSELVRLIKEAMGAFNKAESTAPYQHLIARIESVSTDKRFEFMFSSFMVTDTMAHVLSRILRIPVDG